MTKRAKLILIIVGTIVFLVILAWYCWGYIPGTLYFDSQGGPHGTGVRKYFYTSGAIKLEEQYFNGKLSKSVWFKPDGNILDTTNWENESGIGYYLREDGSISAKIEYVNGLAHGQAIFYRNNGTIERYEQFRNGVEIKK